MWPWVIGIAAAVAAAVLLFSSFIVLVSWRRPPEPTRKVIVANVNPHLFNNGGALPNNGANPNIVGNVTAGQLDGKRPFGKRRFSNTHRTQTDRPD